MRGRSLVFLHWSDGSAGGPIHHAQLWRKVRIVAAGTDGGRMVTADGVQKENGAGEADTAATDGALYGVLRRRVSWSVPTVLCSAGYLER